PLPLVPPLAGPAASIAAKGVSFAASRGGVPPVPPPALIEVAPPSLVPPPLPPLPPAPPVCRVPPPPAPSLSVPPSPSAPPPRGVGRSPRHPTASQPDTSAAAANAGSDGTHLTNGPRAPGRP